MHFNIPVIALCSIPWSDREQPAPPWLKWQQGIKCRKPHSEISSLKLTQSFQTFIGRGFCRVALHHRLVQWDSLHCSVLRISTLLLSERWKQLLSEAKPQVLLWGCHDPHFSVSDWLWHDGDLSHAAFRSEKRRKVLNLQTCSQWSFFVINCHALNRMSRIWLKWIIMKPDLLHHWRPLSSTKCEQLSLNSLCSNRSQSRLF